MLCNMLQQPNSIFADKDHLFLKILPFVLPVSFQIKVF